MQATLTLEGADTPVRLELERQLRAWNDEQAGVPFRDAFAIAVRDQAGALRGGTYSMIYRDCLMIDMVWLQPAFRGAGLGTRMMRETEAEGHARGARLAALDTMSWQARPFYEKLGYRVFGELPHENGKIMRYYMSRVL